MRRTIRQRSARRSSPPTRRMNARRGPRASRCWARAASSRCRKDIACELIALPREWPRIGGMDFGWDHPFAAVELAWDRDADVVYVTKAYRKSQATPIIHAAALKPWGEWLPWAWPRDGRRETLEGAGEALAKQFREQGLNLLYEHARFVDGSVSVEAGLLEMLDRMQTGRFRVFRHL